MNKEERKEYKKAYYEAHKKELKEKQKTYNEAHNEERQEYNQAHKEQRKHHRKAYNQAHKEELKEYMKAYNDDHKNEHKEYMKAYQRQLYCCEDISQIENYNLAKADNFINWDIHHRLETNNSDGERRLVDLSHSELKALDMYYNRPASKLILLKHKEHMQLHNKKI